MAKTPTDIRSLARSHTRTAISTLLGVMANPKAMSSAKVAAAREMLNRGWGRVPDDEEGSASRVIINILKLTGQGDAAPAVIDLPSVRIDRIAADA